MSEKELKKRIKSLYRNHYISKFAYDIIVKQIDIFLNSLPNDEASRVSENEQAKEVCSHIWKEFNQLSDYCIKCFEYKNKEQTG
jgi:hypothetical protein